MAKAGRLAKELMVRELTEAVKQRANFFVASLGRLQAVEADTLRKRLRGVQARALVVKRTLGLRGVADLKLDPALQGGVNGGAIELFSGSVVLVFPGEDLIPAAKLFVDFAKDSQEKLVVRGGWVEGQLLDQPRLTEVASLPSKLQLMAQLIGVLESPMTDAILTIEQVLGDVPWVVEEAAKTVKPVLTGQTESQEGNANG